jgi:hypothetical protein
MSQSSQSQPLLSPEDAADASENIPSPPPLPGEHATTRRLTRSHSQSVLFTEDAPGASVNMPPPPPLPGETSSKRRSTRSTTRGGGGVSSDTPATPVTPSRSVAPSQRTGLRPPAASAMASPNPFTPLGEDEFSNPREDVDAAAPPPASTDPRPQLMAGTRSYTASMRLHSGNWVSSVTYLFHMPISLVMNSVRSISNLPG